MRYKFKAHPTEYAGVKFRSRLEARWAAFFNCMRWKWAYEPADLENWSPDFYLPHLQLMVEVKPYFDKDQFRDHPCWKLGAGFGIDPSVSVWFKDGIIYCLADSVNQSDLSSGWIAAGNLTQWHKKKRKKK